jgi:glycosyltransferase involved in cell wall biosynthesis
MPAELAPVVIFCYNRPRHLEQTLESLRLNPLARQSHLVVFSDGARTDRDVPAVNEVRGLLSKLNGFGTVRVIASPTNRGLAQSVIQGVSEVLKDYERLIVLEDDMLCTSDFLDYMNTALTIYAERREVFSVTGYTPPFTLPYHYKEDAYLAPRASSWGWGTWRNRWETADWQVPDFKYLEKDYTLKKQLNRGGEDLWPMLVKQQRGVIDSWAIRWTLTQSQQGAYGLYPVRSKIRNIGTDGSGTNFTFSTGAYGSELAEGGITLNPHLQPDASVIEAFRDYYRLPWKVKLKNRLKYGV